MDGRRRLLLIACAWATLNTWPADSVAQSNLPARMAATTSGAATRTAAAPRAGSELPTSIPRTVQRGVVRAAHATVDETGESAAAPSTRIEEVLPSAGATKSPPPKPTPSQGRGVVRMRPSVSDSSTASLLGREDPALELVDFREISLSEAAKLLTDQSGLKIVPSAEAAKVVVSLYLKDVKPGVAIDALTKAHGLFYREDAETGIIRIYTTSEYEKDLGSFREERTEVFTLLYPNPLDVAYAIQGAFGDRVLMSVNGWQVDSQQMRDLSQRFARLNLVDQQNRISGGFLNGAGTFGGNTGASGIGGLGGAGGSLGGISGVGGIGGLGASGVGGGSFGFGGFGDVGGFGNFGGSSSQYGGATGNGQNETRAGEPPKRLEKLTSEQIQALDRALQTNNQTAIDELLRSRKADIFVTALPRNNQLVIRTADLASMQRIAELIAQLDVPTPLVLLEVKVLALQLGDEFQSAFDYQFSDGKLTSGGLINNVSDFATGGNILPPATDSNPAGPQKTQPLSPGVFNPATGTVIHGGNPNQNLTFQIVSSNFRMRMQMLESKNRVTQMATPTLLTANNEVSRIFIGRTIPIVVGYNAGTVVGTGTTIVTDGTTGGGTVGASAPITPVTQLRDIGESLLITPNINADRTVTLRVAQESSALDGTTTIPIISGDIQFSPEIDVVRRTTVSGTVVAKDGCTVAIGGLIQEDLTDTRSGVPILGKLPIVGILFRGQATGRQRTELVVMIRPYVFNTPQESAMLSHDLTQELSMHPASPDAVGTLNSFAPQEVLIADPPQSPLQHIFRFHSLEPKNY